MFIRRRDCAVDIEVRDRAEQVLPAPGPQPFDIFQPDTAGQHVVGKVEHVVGLVVGQVHLQQPYLVVDLLG
jgi:hypothetical protein